MNKKILLVDDEAQVTSSLKGLLAGPSISIDTANSLEGTRSLLAGNQYDVVISDLRLSGVLQTEGFEILQYVRDHAPLTKFILLTGYGSAEIQETAFRMGAAFYFEKPVPGRILMNALKDLEVE